MFFRKRPKARNLHAEAADLLEKMMLTQEYNPRYTHGEFMCCRINSARRKFNFDAQLEKFTITQIEQRLCKRNNTLRGHLRDIGVNWGQDHFAWAIEHFNWYWRLIRELRELAKRY